MTKSAGLARQPSAERTRPVRVDMWRILIGATTAAILALVLALWFGDGRPVPSPPGLPDPGRLTGWALPVSRVVTDLAGCLTVGLLLLGAFLLPSRDGDLTASGLRGLRLASWTAGIWGMAALVQLVLTTSDVIGVPLQSLSDPVFVESYVRNVGLGRALLLQAALALVVAVSARFTLTVTGAAGGLLLALAAWIPPTLTGHSAASDEHALATTSLAVHVIAMALWCGGLLALLLVAVVDRAAFPVALRRFSLLALWCVVALFASGLVNAALRLASISNLVTTSYGVVLLGKAALLGVLVGYGVWHRRRVVPRLDLESRRSFVRAAGAEVLVMATAVGLAVALSRTPPPAPVDESLARASAARILLGFDLPPVPTLSRLAWGEARVDAFFLVAALVLATLYVAGVRSLSRRGNRWPWGRTASWSGGLVLLVLATSSGVGTYSQVLFSVHMLQHMLLSMIVPILLVLGAPITLALRTLPSGPGPRQWLLAFLHSRPVAVVSNPLVAAAIFVGSFYVLYFTSAFPILMRSHWGHVLMSVHFLLAGSLFFWVLIGVDPGPKRPPYVFRLLLLLVAMPLHAFFSIAVMSASTVLGESFFAALERTYATDLLADQRLGAGVGWAMGEIPIALVLGVLFVQWMRSDEKQARRFDRAADLTERGDVRVRDELGDYNAYLASLAERDKR